MLRAKILERSISSNTRITLNLGGLSRVKSLKKLMKIYPNWKEADLEVLDKIITDRELEELIEAHGIESK